MEYLVRFGAKPWLDAAKSPTRNFRFSAEGRESIPVLLEGHESTEWATWGIGYSCFSHFLYFSESLSSSVNIFNYT